MAWLCCMHTPENQIRITGKMDKDEGKDIEIDVKSLEVLK